MIPNLFSEYCGDSAKNRLLEVHISVCQQTPVMAASLYHTVLSYVVVIYVVFIVRDTSCKVAVLIN